MVIQHNMLSAYAGTQINKNNKALTKSTARLSSGFKVNSAADNAAALSISEGMRAQIRGLNKASSNVQDGISYVQVADGALSEVQDMLQRINELSIQSSNATNTPEDRAALNSEINQIKAEINRVFTDTEFNTRKIWDENAPSRVQIGSKPTQVASHSASFDIPITDANKGYVPVNSVETVISDSSTDGLKAMQLKWKGADGKEYTTEKVDINPGGGTISFPNKVSADGVQSEISGANLKFIYNPDAKATYDQLVDSIDGV